MMQSLRKPGLFVVMVVLAVALAFGASAGMRGWDAEAAALPASSWWLVVHDQCDDTLHWINDAGEFAAIPRPQLPGEAPGAACSYKALHISQDGRYMVLAAPLTSGRNGIGFYDLQAGTWLQVHQAQPDEQVYLGARYSSDAANRIAIGLANAASAARAWRVIVFDLTSGDALDVLRSDGAEIAGFVGGEFLAMADVYPHVAVVSDDPIGGGYRVDVRFDPLDGTGDPLGAVAWYPGGAPGVTQELISSPYAAPDSDLLPDRRAIYAYNEPAFPAGPPVGTAPHIIDSNAVGLLQPTGPDDIDPDLTVYFADGVHTIYGPQWAADGEVALFRLHDGTEERVHWVRIGTAVLVPMGQPIAQILGVPIGFVYSTGDGIYFQDVSAPDPTGPVFTDPMISGSMAFVWATAFGDPALALDQPAEPLVPLPEDPIATITPLPATPPPSTGQPDLFVSEFALDPATPVQGQPVQVRVGVYNQGDAAASGTFRVEWYPGEGYASPACDWTIDGLVAVGGRILTCTYAGYPSPYSSINTLVKVDPTNTVAESNEGNNTYTQAISVTSPAPAAQPDLFVSEFALDPATPVKGQPVQVRVGVYNQGSAAVSGTPFRIEWYPGENYGAPGCDWTLDSMSAGGGRILTCTYAGYPSPYSSINTLVKVDPTNTVAESNEGNNTYTQAISVTSPAPAAQPDLFVSEFALDPATPVKGQPVQVRVGVYNQGSAAVSGTPFRIEWYPGENYGAPGCDWTLDSMSAGGGRILTCTYAGYPSPYSSINTLVKVDPTNTVAESNEGNNDYRQAISVSSP